MNSNGKGKNEAYYNSKLKYEQMSKQQQLIEQKKQEIQQRLEEKKKKETEEALKKLNDGNKQKSNDPRSRRSYYGSYSKNKITIGEPEKEPNLPTNIFSNDGSFFQQFQKISGIKVEVRKKSSSHRKKTSDMSSAVVQNETVIDVSEKKDSQNESKPEPNSVESKPKEMPQQNMPEVQNQQGANVIQQQPIITNHAIQHRPMMHQPHQMMNLQPPLHQQIFTPQQRMPMPAMNFPPQFNPMQCGMMVPPPLAPSSIPPPAPMNPGLIPSPSPLQPCSIPSPSPLQPYAIPPPSPLLPHSIPPPSPMVPHSIPPPSPLTPHSIPPPLPLRPQNIPPPLQRPPLFLTLAPPPPPPPPEEEKPKEVKSKEEKFNFKEESTNVEIPEEQSKESIISSNPLPYKPDEFKEISIENNVKDLFKNDEYSSSSDEEKENLYGQSNKRNTTSSDSESERGRKYSDSNSDKESDDESDRKIGSYSEMSSEIDHESRPTHEKESGNENQPYDPIVIEDTQTQFPSDNKDTSNHGESAPPDQCSEGDSLSKHQGSADSNLAFHSSQHQSVTQVKQEPQDMFDDTFVGSVTQAEAASVKVECTKELKTEVKEEKVKYQNFVQAKPESLDSTAEGATVKSEEPPKKKRKSRWATNDEAMPPNMSIPPPPPPPIGVVMPKVLGGVNLVVPPLPPTVPAINVPGMSGALISKVGRSDPALVAYAMKSYGHTNLNDAEWKKVEDHYKISLLYQDMMRKREELERLQAAGKNKYEYDSDEDTDGGTWEHKLRSAEMEATQLWADELTEQAKGKHHIGDFLPPDELARFMEKYEAVKDGREPDLSDYKEFKLKEDNVGFQMLQKLGWTEGQGLGPDGSGIMDPVNKAVMRPENQGLGVERPDDVEADDDEYDAYRKRMMLAYRFRPNPMNNPRRPYY